MTDITTATEQQILEAPVTGSAGRTQRVDFERPQTDKELEVVWLTDASGSNQEQVSHDSSLLKVDFVINMAPGFIAALENDDAQAKEEQSGGSSELGGLRTFAFSRDEEFEFEDGEDESEDERDLGDINTANRVEKLDIYRTLVMEGQQTYVMPAIRAAEAAFKAEFANPKSPHFKPLRNRPAQEILITTDGVLNDDEEFEDWLRTLSEDAVACCAVYGEGREHDRAVNSWMKLATKSSYLSVVALTGVSNPEEAALDLRLLSGTAPQS